MGHMFGTTCEGRRACTVLYYSMFYVERSKDTLKASPKSCKIDIYSLDTPCSEESICRNLSIEGTQLIENLLFAREGPENDPEDR